ncbi:MAG TPA: hypothetical protein VNA87_05860 [Actinomycetota bacterium]|nr:hypothetical protein [Actinomycetota bacterium]
MSAIRAIDVTKKYRKGTIALRGLDLIRPTTGVIELFGGPSEHADRRALVGFAPEVPTEVRG